MPRSVHARCLFSSLAELAQFLLEAPGLIPALHETLTLLEHRTLKRQPLRVQAHP